MFFATIKPKQAQTSHIHRNDGQKLLGDYGAMTDASEDEVICVGDIRGGEGDPELNLARDATHQHCGGGVSGRPH
jgi:hypothetical protein